MIEHSQKSVTEYIQTRFSCRTFSNEPIPRDRLDLLNHFINELPTAPGNSLMRFLIAAADDQDRSALKGLGTYGYIKSPTAFIIGALTQSPFNLEDYGYQLERIVLYATQLGIGTCWLGGTFTKSRFAQKVQLIPQETIPAVIAMGLIADEAQSRQTKLRKRIGADHRLPWEMLFFEEQFSQSLKPNRAGVYQTPLEMLRLGPSASNKQPWRAVIQKGRIHLFMQRTKGYRNAFTRLAGIDDMQRLDMGIAMCHFELTARELGIPGRWIDQVPEIEKPDPLTEYCRSWEQL